MVPPCLNLAGKCHEGRARITGFSRRANAMAGCPRPSVANDFGLASRLKDHPPPRLTIAWATVAFAGLSPFTVAGQRRFQTELSNSPEALASGTRSIVWSAPAPQRRHSRHSSFQHMHHKSARKSISKNMLLCQWQKPGATLLWRSQRKRYTPQKRDVPCKQRKKTGRHTHAHAGCP